MRELGKTRIEEMVPHVPCGRCLYCRIRRRSEWKLRLMMEHDYCGSSRFITLTYNDENIRKVFTNDKQQTIETLRKKDLQLFQKRVRKYLGSKAVRFYSVGEYGDTTQRPHFHSIVFFRDNLHVNDMVILDQAWTTGEGKPIGHLFGTIDYKGDEEPGEVTPESIQYVAGYIDKKIYGEKSDDHYQGRVPEFNICSQGIGKQWLYDNFNSVVSNGYIMYKGRSYPVPRYFDKKIREEVSPKRLEVYLRKKRLARISRMADYDNDLLNELYERHPDYFSDVSTPDLNTPRHKMKLQNAEQMDLNLKSQIKLKLEKRKKI